MEFDKTRQWRIQDFSEEGALTPKGVGAPTYYLANFSRKLHENEEILGQGGRASLVPPLDPPLLGGPAHAIVTKTVHKTLSRGSGVKRAGVKGPVGSKGR